MTMVETADQPAPQWHDPRLVEMRARLRRLAGTTIDSARAVGLSDLVESLSAELDRVDELSPAMVLFAGEPSTGKTSLINALVGMPDLLPVDVDVATNSYVLVVAGNAPQAWVFRSGSERGEPVEVATLDEWVSEAGNPGNHHLAIRAPRCVRSTSRVVVHRQRRCQPV